jgi:phage shock protein C
MEGEKAMGRYKRMMSRGLYRSRNGIFLGVCLGVAQFLDFSVFGVRVIMVVLLIFTGLWPVVFLYFLAALVMKPEPVIPLTTEDEEEFYHHYLHSEKAAVGRLKRKFDNLERRIRHMEDSVTSRDIDFEQRLHRK